MPKRMGDKAGGGRQDHAKKSRHAYKAKCTPLKAQQDASKRPEEHPKHSRSSKAVLSETDATPSALPQHKQQKPNAGIIKPRWRTHRNKRRSRKQLLKQQPLLLHGNGSRRSGQQKPHHNNPAVASLEDAGPTLTPQRNRVQHVCTHTTLMCAPAKSWTIAGGLPTRAAPTKPDGTSTDVQVLSSIAIPTRNTTSGGLPDPISCSREILNSSFERRGRRHQSGLIGRSPSSCCSVTPDQRSNPPQIPKLRSIVPRSGACIQHRPSLLVHQRALTIPSRSTPIHAERAFRDFSRFVGESSDTSDTDSSPRSDTGDDFEQESKQHVDNILDKADPPELQPKHSRDNRSKDAEESAERFSGPGLKHKMRNQVIPSRQRASQSTQRPTHAAVTNTDDEDDNVEQKLFDDIRKVWEEVTSITRSTSLSTKIMTASAAKPSSMTKKPKIGYYDLPDGPLSPPTVMCHQAVIDEQSPLATRKRKRVTGTSSKHVSSEQEPKSQLTAVPRDNTPINIDTSLCSISGEEVCHIDDQNCSVAAQNTSITTKKRRAPAGVSTALFPPISSDRFGLLQEKLWQEPFWLLIGVTFLNKTAGKSAAPVFWQLKERYPTPADLADADLNDVSDMITHLGLQTQRATRLLKMAKAWHGAPPMKGRLHRTLHYPQRGEGKEYGLETAIETDIPVVAGALEIGHIPGCGPYAWDSWRIFCRDALRGVADDYNGLNAAENFEPEWQRVLPMDKELRACLRWMWLREGYIWDHETGRRREVNEIEREKAIKGELGPTDEDEIKFTARAQEMTLTPVKVPTRRSLRLSVP
ncbi:hypothetical protein AMS68_003526 [Peltaster fructicola]|uniref:HhH-GPD domain-containing protein n=1 Tax=Peltaster fructicola TaxID=286661 RepID=A0A6H0XTR5_9PEZI|nr:hypothetical protein AMS68_003526 [Peltaster fructicola]